MSTITENGSVVENTNTVDNAVDNTVVADVPASHESTASVETPVSQKQADAVNAEKDVKSDMVMSAFKNILPQWAKNLLQNPAIPALMVGLTAGPLAGVATFGAGALAKQFVKMNDTINAYKNKLVEDKDIQLNKDGTLAYTGTGTIKGSECLPGSCFGPFGKNPSHSLDGQSFGNIPTPHPPQLPPTVGDPKKETPKTEVKKEEPKAEPKTEEPKKEEPKKEEPKKAEPKKEEPKKEEPKKEGPKKEEPKKEEPKKEEPKKEEPKKEEPKAEPKKEEPSIPQPVGGVSPKVPETQPTVEIPAPINQAPTTEAKPADKGDVIVTKPRVIKVGGEDKEAKENEEVEPKSGSSKEDRETDGEGKEDSKDSNVGIWENRDDIDANDTKDNKGGDYSNNNDNKSVSSAYEDLINSITEPTAPSDDGPEL